MDKGFTHLKRGSRKRAFITGVRIHNDGRVQITEQFDDLTEGKDYVRMLFDKKGIVQMYFLDKDEDGAYSLCYQRDGQRFLQLRGLMSRLKIKVAAPCGREATVVKAGDDVGITFDIKGAHVVPFKAKGAMHDDDN